MHVHTCTRTHAPNKGTCSQFIQRDTGTHMFASAFKIKVWNISKGRLGRCKYCEVFFIRLVVYSCVGPW